MNSRVQVLPGHRTSQLTPEKRKLDPENLLENLLCNFCSSQKAELEFATPPRYQNHLEITKKNL